MMDSESTHSSTPSNSTPSLGSTNNHNNNQTEDQSEESSSSSTNVSTANAFREFLRDAAKTTKQGVDVVLQKIEYVAKQHKVIDAFKHDEEVTQRIDILDQISKQSRQISAVSNSWLQREKDFMYSEIRHQGKILSLSKTFQPIQLEELLMAWATTQQTLIEFHNAYLTSMAAEFTRPLSAFVRNNVKQANMKKKECNYVSIERENVAKAFQRKQDAENKKEYEKRDHLGLKLAEEKMNDCESHYDLIAGELLMLIDSLEMKQRHELPRCMMALITAQEVCLKNSLDTLSQLKLQLAPIIDELESKDFQPRYRALESKKKASQDDSDEDKDSDDNDDLDDSDEDKSPPVLPPKPSFSTTSPSSTRPPPPPFAPINFENNDDNNNISSQKEKDDNTRFEASAPPLTPKYKNHLPPLPPKPSSSSTSQEKCSDDSGLD